MPRSWTVPWVHRVRRCTGAMGRVAGIGQQGREQGRDGRLAIAKAGRHASGVVARKAPVPQRDAALAAQAGRADDGSLTDWSSSVASR